jgi:hypothetical protein
MNEAVASPEVHHHGEPSLVDLTFTPTATAACTRPRPPPHGRRLPRSPQAGSQQRAIPGPLRLELSPKVPRTVVHSNGVQSPLFGTSSSSRRRSEGRPIDLAARTPPLGASTWVQEPRRYRDKARSRKSPETQREAAATAAERRRHHLEHTPQQITPFASAAACTSTSTPPHAGASHRPLPCGSNGRKAGAPLLAQNEGENAFGYVNTPSSDAMMASPCDFLQLPLTADDYPQTADDIELQEALLMSMTSAAAGFPASAAAVATAPRQLTSARQGGAATRATCGRDSPKCSAHSWPAKDCSSPASRSFSACGGQWASMAADSEGHRAIPGRARQRFGQSCEGWVLDRTATNREASMQMDDGELLEWRGRRGCGVRPVGGGLARDEHLAHALHAGENRSEAGCGLVSDEMLAQYLSEMQSASDLDVAAGSAAGPAAGRQRGEFSLCALQANPERGGARQAPAAGRCGVGRFSESDEQLARALQQELLEQDRLGAGSHGAAEGQSAWEVAMGCSNCPTATHSPRGHNLGFDEAMPSQFSLAQGMHGSRLSGVDLIAV